MHKNCRLYKNLECLTDIEKSFFSMIYGTEIESVLKPNNVSEMEYCKKIRDNFVKYIECIDDNNIKHLQAVKLLYKRVIEGTCLDGGYVSNRGEFGDLLNQLFRDKDKSNEVSIILRAIAHKHFTNYSDEFDFITDYFAHPNNHIREIVSVCTENELLSILCFCNYKVDKALEILKKK